METAPRVAFEICELYIRQAQLNKRQNKISVRACSKGQKSAKLNHKQQPKNHQMRIILQYSQCIRSPSVRDAIDHIGDLTINMQTIEYSNEGNKVKLGRLTITCQNNGLTLWRLDDTRLIASTNAARNHIHSAHISLLRKIVLFEPCYIWCWG